MRLTMPIWTRRPPPSCNSLDKRKVKAPSAVLRCPSAALKVKFGVLEGPRVLPPFVTTKELRRAGNAMPGGELQGRRK